MSQASCDRGRHGCHHPCDRSPSHDWKIMKEDDPELNMHFDITNYEVHHCILVCQSVLQILQCEAIPDIQGDPKKPEPIQMFINPT